MSFSTTGKKLPQIVAAVGAAMGVFALGAALGWAQPAQKKVLDGEYQFAVNLDEFSWAVSLLTLGPACSCIPIGYISDAMGLRNTMLVLTLPYLGAFVLQTFAINLTMLYIARFCVGLVGGAFCITMPLYAVEISQTNVRGLLSSFYQEFIVSGMAFSYVIGPFMSLFWFNIVLLCLPVVFFTLFYIMPESPKYYVTRNKIDKAIASLRWLRGKDYDCILEAYAIAATHTKSQENPVTLSKAMRRPVTLKALAISITLMFVKQFSGINTIIFYWTGILREVGSPLDPDIATIIIGVLSVISTLIAVFTVDKLGRRINLLVSSSLQALTSAIIGTYFFFEQLDKSSVANFKWLPIPTVCVFVCAFSLGVGPVPWIIMAELFTPEVRRLAAPIVGMSSWIFVFISIATFTYTADAIGAGPLFWGYSICSIFGFIFVLFFLPETKGLKIEKIQQILAGDTRKTDLENGN